MHNNFDNCCNSFCCGNSCCDNSCCNNSVCNNSCCNNPCCDNNCCNPCCDSNCCNPCFGGGGLNLIDCLCANVGRVVTIFTASGGASGSGFTGLLVWANNQTVKIVTNLPSAPPNPLGDCGCNNGLFWNSNYCNGSMYGSVVVIPTCQIVSFVFSEI